LQISGHGFGHLLGMCQWGAKFMGDEGYNYENILKFYYPRTKISKLQSLKK
jgi:SpoIID/LytB domain protein